MTRERSYNLWLYLSSLYLTPLLLLSTLVENEFPKKFFFSSHFEIAKGNGEKKGEMQQCLLITGGIFRFVTGRVEILATSSGALLIRQPTGKAAPQKKGVMKDIEQHLIEVLPHFYPRVDDESRHRMLTPFVLITHGSTATEVLEATLHALYPERRKRPVVTYSMDLQDAVEKDETNVESIVRRTLSKEVVHSSSEKMVVTPQVASRRIPPQCIVPADVASGLEGARAIVASSTRGVTETNIFETTEVQKYTRGDPYGREDILIAAPRPGGQRYQGWRHLLRDSSLLRCDGDHLQLHTPFQLKKVSEWISLKVGSHEVCTLQRMSSLPSSIQTLSAPRTPQHVHGSRG